MNDREYQIIKDIARSVTKRNRSNMYEAGDLYAAGWQAVQEFHKKFPDVQDDALIRKICRRRMIDYLRISSGHRRITASSKAVRFSDITTRSRSNNDPSLDFNQFVEDPKTLDGVLPTELMDDVDFLIKGLPKRERQIVMMLIGGWSQDDISKLMNVTPSRICQIVNRSIVPHVTQAIEKRKQLD